MKSLSKNSKDVFIKIINEMGEKQHMKLQAQHFLPLTIELLDVGIDTVLGKANNYSFCNYYDLNGDLMQAPEMCFLVIGDCTVEKRGYLEKVNIIPYMFQYADICLYECSIIISHKRVVQVKEQMQIRHTQLAEQWLQEIKTIGYLKF
ncbi:hypothetical protein D3C87_130360 [compost metagenome]